MALGKASGAKTAKSGKGGGNAGAVQKPWLKSAALAAGRSAVADKPRARPTPPWERMAQKAAPTRATPQRGAGKGGRSSIQGGRLVRSVQKENGLRGKAASGASKAKAVRKTSKGPGKGTKGRGKVAAPVNSVFWKKKVEDENRVEADDVTFTGTIVSYSPKGGWGFIEPDEPEMLPEDVRTAIEEAVERATAAGKDVKWDTHLYFRKPDVVKGFRCEFGKACSFQVYTDDKGAGAFEITGVDGDEAE
eukprot:CAMPEP_0117492940 /NCGR_PEP_ID=MMETSP0784-20121206/18843_1 /TAXON_ID=39447 /ORGANISM="" /LENGTH=247 /DNA_ID=CAMNT_0005287781 /DNA_START=105 /DNA_END=848 /DNA_ORIENTATION=+